MRRCRVFVSLLLVLGLSGIATTTLAQQSPPGAQDDPVHAPPGGLFPPGPPPGDMHGPPPPPRPWQSLSPDERNILAPLGDKWNTFPPERQARMLERAQQWKSLPPDQREAIRQRIDQWQKMTPQQREHFEALRKLEAGAKSSAT